MKNNSFFKKSSGFTLIEVIIVIIILAILSVIAIPRMAIVIEKEKAKQGVKLLYDLYSAQKRFAIDNNGSYTLNITDLDIYEPTLLPSVPAGYLVLVQNGPIVLAEFRKTGTYRMYMYADGTIHCTNIGANTMCTQMGYQP